MTINLTNFSVALQAKLDALAGSENSQEYLLLAKAFESSKLDGVKTVATVSALPVASTNTSQLIFVEADSSLYFSNGTAWVKAVSGTGTGTIAAQDSDDVSITGGVIDGTVIGGVTPAAITGTTITATSFVGDLTGNVTGNLTGDVTGNLTGDVTGDVTGNLTGDVTGDVTGNVTGNVIGNITGDVTGNADSATVLQTARNIDVNGTDFTSTPASFDGSADATVTLGLTTTGVTANTYGSATAIPSFTVDDKGRISSATTHSIATTLNITDGTTSDSVSLLSDTLTFSDVTNQTNVVVSNNEVTVGLVDSPSIVGNLTIGGNLTVNGTTTTVNATNLSVTDNLIYLAEGNSTTNIDLGFAGNYNDGTYAHAGFFRDASDGRWKVFDGYTPEPDAAVDIDTTHASFSLADIQAGTFYGALSGNASTATTLQTARSIGLTGDVTGSASFDGAANASITATLASSGVTAGSYGDANNIPAITVDAKGRLTSVTNTAVAIPSGSLTFTGDVTGTGTTGSSTALTLASSGVTAGTYGSSTAIPAITVDAKGRVTSATTSSISVGDGSFTVNTGGGLTGGAQLGTANQSGNTSITISHADTSSQDSVDNSGATVIQDITLDTYGHVTGIGSATLSYDTVGAPSTTGTNASGTWQISITGNAATATSATDSTKLPLSGGTLTGAVTGTQFIASDWLRSTGNTGWYNNTHGGGINMEDTTWVRVYNSKAFYVANQIAATGNVTAYYSDERLKTKVADIDSALDKVKSLTGFYYVENALAKSFGYNNDKQQVALSAQDVKAVMPEAVSLAAFDMETKEDGSIVSKSGEDYLTVDYARLVPLLVEAIKEQDKKIEKLEALVEQLLQK